MSDREGSGGSDWPIGADAVGMLVSLLDAGSLDSRRYVVVNRLRALRDSDDFATLPEDLRERVREILDAAP